MTDVWSQVGGKHWADMIDYCKKCTAAQEVNYKLSLQSLELVKEEHQYILSHYWITSGLDTTCTTYILSVCDCHIYSWTN